MAYPRCYLWAGGGDLEMATLRLAFKIEGDNEDERKIGRLARGPRRLDLK